MTVEETIESVKELKAYNKNGELATPVNEGISMWWDGVFGKVLDCLSEIQQYRAIGTVSEFRELKEKATARKPYYVQYETNPNDINYHCPTCNRFVLYTHPICSCGQKLDWSEGKE